MGRPRPQRELRSFADTLDSLAGNPAPLPEAKTCVTPDRKLCQLCWGSRLRYAEEQSLKRRALESWSRQFRGLPAPEFVPSPSGRNYRTVSKRRWLAPKRQLVMVEEVSHGRPRGLAITDCLAEQPGHAEIYRHLQEVLPGSPVAALLNYAVIKGTAREFVLILNVTDLRHERSAFNRLSKQLTARVPGLKGIWLARGERGDDYYLNVSEWQKLYGTEQLTTDQQLQFTPQTFTQINPWMVPELLRRTERWLGDPSLPLLDLYCGYGLFSLALPRTGPCSGYELSSASVQWARRNARRLRRTHARFDVWNLGTRKLPETRRPEGRWVAVIDPPRSGVAPALAEQVAAWRPLRIVHWVCDVERLDPQLQLWKRLGYRPVATCALDMFAGTDSLEFGMLLEGIGSPKANQGRA